MVDCARCGKKTNYWHSVWTFRDFFPEFQGKRLCQDCIEECNKIRLKAKAEQSQSGDVNGEICASCRKRLGFRDKSKAFHLTVYLNAINSGLFPEYKDKKVCISCQRLLLDSKGIKFRGLYGLTKGNERVGEIVKENSPLSNPSNVMCSNCAFSSTTTIQVEKASLTNIMGAITGAGTMDYEYLDKWTCSKFKFDVTNRLNLAGSCSSYVTETDYERKCLSGEMDKDKEHIQIILDFSSLKDVMAKGGLVMTTYKCPNCNGMVNIPEAGKILMCQYCGTPIKPVDIFEKIKDIIK